MSENERKFTTTTISTIAIHSGKTKIVVALLKVGLVPCRIDKPLMTEQFTRDANYCTVPVPHTNPTYS
jgi:hypothetical protein